MVPLERFYEDERRRDSREVKYGSGWRDRAHELFRFDVFWIEDTQELCLLRYPVREPYLTGAYQHWFTPVPLHAELSRLPDDQVSVEVLATLTEEDVEERLEDWDQHVTEHDGVAWLRTLL